jgi:hypothetical protein
LVGTLRFAHPEHPHLQASAVAACDAFGKHHAGGGIVAELLELDLIVYHSAYRQVGGGPKPRHLTIANGRTIL